MDDQIVEPEEIEPETGISLRNGDVIDGNIIGIENGNVEIQTSMKSFKLPVSRLRNFVLRTAEDADNPELRWEPILRNGDIRAWFSQGGHITFQLTGSKGNLLIGKSQTFGEAAFQIDAFSRLEFNLY